MDPVKAHWAAEFTNYRAEHGIDKRQLASDLGVTTRTVSRIENAKNRPSATLIENFERVTEGHITVPVPYAILDPLPDYDPHIAYINARIRRLSDLHRVVTSQIENLQRQARERHAQLKKGDTA